MNSVSPAASAPAGFAAEIGHRLESLLPPRLRGRFGRRFRNVDAFYLDPKLADIDALSAALAADEAAHALIEPLGGIGNKTAAPVLLIADQHVGMVRKWTTHWPVGQRVEIYSSGGMPGFAFGDMPYMPPAFAQAVLDNAGSGNIRRASARDRFLAGLYRALYLTPHRSDADIMEVFPGTRPSQAARDHGLSVDDWTSLADVDAFLDAQGWRPPLDMLERIACWNPWVAELLRAEGNWLGAETPGLTVFYIRQAAIDQGKLDLIVSRLGHAGFTILPVPDLADDQLAEIARHVRGGNWGRGPYPRSGGVPGRIVLGFDPAPISPDPDLLKQFPLLDNARVQIAKREVRDAVHAGLPRRARYNAMHSTDNAVQAWRAIGEMWPDLTPQLRALLDR